ncbi:Uncharacterised protein [Vibrio cholerae]|nr:Uncharacterised protein [Vibrio cholerae]
MTGYEYHRNPRPSRHPRRRNRCAHPAHAVHSRNAPLRSHHYARHECSPFVNQGGNAPVAVLPVDFPLSSG